MADQLRVVTGVSLDDENAALIVRLEPRVELVRAPSLTTPWLWPADWEGDPEFARTPQQQAEFDSLIDSADALFGVPDVSPAALRRTVERNHELRWVHTTAAGGGSVVRKAGLSDHDLQRVTFTTSAGIHAAPLAEFAIFGILAGAKELRALERNQAVRHWRDGRHAMQQLEDMTVLVVGLGGIGRATAARLQAFGVTVWGTSRRPDPVEHVDRIVALDELGDVVGEIDAMVIALPETPLTIGLIDQGVLGRVRRGATIVNVGRGTVLDESALLRALNDGRVGFAALDVTAIEPLPEDSPLWSHERVLISPHTAALSPHEARRIATLFAENATAFLDGTPMRNVMNTAEFY